MTTPHLPLLLWFLVVSAIAAPTGLSGNNITFKPKHIMVISPPAHSHVALLREIAIGLKEEYPEYRVTFVTGGKYLKMIDEVLAPGVEVMNGVATDRDCNLEMPPELAHHLERLAPGEFVADPGIFKVIAQVIPQVYECMYDPLKEVMAREKPDYVFFDNFGAAARDVAMAQGIDYGILLMLSMGDLGFEMWLPPGHVGGRLADMHGFTYRLKNLVKMVQTIMSVRTIAEVVQMPRAARGFPKPAIGEIHQDHLVLLPEVWGFNYARPLPPLVNHVGFLPPPHDSPRAAMLTNPEKDKVLFDWLDSLPDDSFLIYVAFGSHLTVSEKLINRILLPLLQSDPKVLVLLAMKNPDAPIGSFPDEVKPRLRRETWVPQSRVLQHRHVKIFVTHGGLSSVSEGIYAEVPMIAFPFFGDQPRNGYLLQEAGAGYVFIHTRFQAEELISAVRNLKSNYSSFHAGVAKLHQISEWEGGRKQAARLIHRHLQLGSDHLKNVQNQFSFVERYNLDFLGILLVLVLLVLYVVYRILKGLICCIFCRSGRSEAKKKTD